MHTGLITDSGIEELCANRRPRPSTVATDHGDVEGSAATQ